MKERNYQKNFPTEVGHQEGGLGKLLEKLDETGSVQRKAGSERPRTVRTEENIDKVSTAILSQDHKPGTHETPNQIAKCTGISRANVMRIVKEEQQLQHFKN